MKRPHPISCSEGPPRAKLRVFNFISYRINTMHAANTKPMDKVMALRGSGGTYLATMLMSNYRGYNLNIYLCSIFYASYIDITFNALFFAFTAAVWHWLLQ